MFNRIANSRPSGVLIREVESCCKKAPLNNLRNKKGALFHWPNASSLGAPRLLRTFRLFTVLVAQQNVIRALEALSSIAESVERPPPGACIKRGVRASATARATMTDTAAALALRP